MKPYKIKNAKLSSELKLNDLITTNLYRIKSLDTKFKIVGMLIPNQHPDNSLQNWIYTFDSEALALGKTGFYKDSSINEKYVKFLDEDIIIHVRISDLLTFKTYLLVEPINFYLTSKIICIPEFVGIKRFNSNIIKL